MKKNNMVRLISYVTKEQKKEISKKAKALETTTSDIIRNLINNL